MNLRTSILTTYLLLVFEPLLFAHPPQSEAPKIDTSRKSPVVLPLPKEEDVFHFIIFGDRTGGPAEGIKVLSQAVKDTNLLAPDLVMTVGDLVQGYNTTPDWLKQMKEFKGVMSDLKMPWFPVAGNHDVYWRGKDKPPGEHEKNYELHFGPLWYSFRHKNTGFVVLYTDEGDPKTGEKGYGKPSLVQMSPAQLTWLEKTLKKLAGLDHVFVFLHHPRWVEQWYKGSNWSTVHSLLAKAGNVRAVFAGHIHRMRYDGKKDGIEYFSLATTGGSNPGIFPKVGYLHHMNVVTVRKDRYSVAAIPVGAVMDPRQFTALRQTDIDLLRKLSPTREGKPIELSPSGESAGYYKLTITNPASKPIEVVATPEASGAAWMFLPSHRHIALKPGQKTSLEFAVVHKGPLASSFQAPKLDLAIDYLEDKARIRVPPRKVSLDIGLRELPESFFEPKRNGVLALDGKGAVRLPANILRSHQGAFTVEAWVKPTKFGDSQAVLAKTQSSEFALFVNKGTPLFDVFLGEKYVSARGTESLKIGEWHHLAGVFDGEAVSLFVDGKRVARTATDARRRKTNTLPLFVGADPDGSGNPTRQFVGRIDEVRINKGATYTDSFEPAKRFGLDKGTAVLLHCDKFVGPFSADHSGKNHGVKVGPVRIANEER